MDRRKFAVTAGVGAAGAVTGAPAIAQQNPTVKWRWVSSFPKTLVSSWPMTQAFAKRVGELTDGKFQIQLFGPGEIVAPLAVLDAVQSGAVEAGLSASFFYYGKDPSFAFGTAIPFGLNTRQHQAWVYQGGGLELLNEFHGKYGVHYVPMGLTGAQMGGWYRKEINTVDDMNGLKIRIAGLGGELLARMGAVPQQLGAGDIYTALEKGTIDAAEFVAPYDDEKLGLHKVAPNYYAPGFWEPGPAVHFFVNKQEWDKLPKEYQAAFQAASREAHILMTASYDHKNPQALARLLSQGVKLQRFSNEIMKKAYDISQEMYAEESAKNPAWKKIYTEFVKYRQSQNAWFGVAEASYDRFMQSIR